MKIQTNCSIDENDFGIAFIPTIVFYKDNTEKILSFIWLVFEIQINF